MSHAHHLESGDSRLRCPKDGTLMEKSTIAGTGGVIVDRCAKCGAVWLDKNELERIIAAGAAEKVDLGPFGKDKPNGPIAPLQCPRDWTVLTEVADSKQMHVLVMVCSDCGGKLLDAGELIDLAHFTVGERIKLVFSRV